MSNLYVIYGNVSSGKTTLAKKLSERLDVKHFSSDGIREEISGNVGGPSRGVFNGKPFNVWVTFKERVDKELNEGRDVIADSTGMSKDFCEIINNYDNCNKWIIKLESNINTWKEREKLRTDRWQIKNGEKQSFEMPIRAFKDSSNVPALKPDIIIKTDNMTKDEVFEKALGLLVLGETVRDFYRKLV